MNRYIVGWTAYFELADTPSVFEGLDGWVRRRLRQMLWKRWKRGTRRYQELVSVEIPKERAALGAVGTSHWRMSRTPVINEALSNAFWQNTGLESIAKRYFKLRYSY